MKNKLNIKVVSGIIAGVVLALVIKNYAVPYLFRPSIDSELLAFSSEMNKSCPIMVDSDTRLDNTIAGDEKNLIYNYTLVNHSKDEVDLNFLQDEFRPMLLNMVKTNPEMQYLRDHDISFTYSYKDRFGVHIASLKFTPKDYKE